MSHKQLTREQRYTIELELKEGKSPSEIALKIGVHRATIYREINRNSKTAENYCFDHADNKAMERRPRSWSKYQDWSEIDELIRKDWSPEQIHGSLLTQDKVAPSIQTVYNHIQEDKEKGGDLHSHLRRSNKRYRERGDQKDKRGQMKERVDISLRPSEVNDKLRIGDWEADTVVGRIGGKVLVTLVERLSRYTLIGLAENKTAEAVKNVILKLMENHKNKVFTITYDNGKEFSYHYEINNSLQIESYFATPYRSWERGLNENTNGLIRQYLPKQTSFDDLTEKDIQLIQDKLNFRPRKCLDFATPNAIFLPS